MDLGFLGTKIVGLPLWAWGGIAIGGIFLTRFLSNKFNGTTGQTTSAAGSAASTDPNIDPNTGVPYSIESQINPSTGLPAYYGGAGVSSPATTNNSQTPAVSSSSAPAAPTTPTTDTTTAANTPTPTPPAVVASTPVVTGPPTPDPSGTAGESNNFWTAVTRSGETFTQFIQRTTGGTAQPASFFQTYRNNPAILNYYLTPAQRQAGNVLSQPLPAGVAFSL